MITPTCRLTADNLSSSFGRISAPEIMHVAHALGASAFAEDTAEDEKSSGLHVDIPPADLGTMRSPDSPPSTVDHGDTEDGTVVSSNLVPDTPSGPTVHFTAQEGSSTVHVLLEDSTDSATGETGDGTDSASLGVREADVDLREMLAAHRLAPDQEEEMMVPSTSAPQPSDEASDSESPGGPPSKARMTEEKVDGQFSPLHAFAAKAQKAFELVQAETKSSVHDPDSTPPPTPPSFSSRPPPSVRKLMSRGDLQAHIEQQFPGRHVFVFVHGYQGELLFVLTKKVPENCHTGNSWDMRLIKNHLSVLVPDGLFLLSASNESSTEVSPAYLLLPPSVHDSRRAISRRWVLG